jgi:CspA family cold shock protein
MPEAPHPGLPKPRRPSLAPAGIHSLDVQENGMAVGIVKWFNATKGYGFIQPEGGGNDVFVHVTAVQRAGLDKLDEGQRVRYELVRDRGRVAAGNLASAD